MSDEPISPARLDAEVASLDHWRRRMRQADDEAADLGAPPPVVRFRSAAPAVGRTLAGRLAPFNRKRYQKLLRYERQPEADYEQAAMTACWMIETELAHGLAAPALLAAGRMCDLLARYERPGSAECLDRWATGARRFPHNPRTTMGVVCLVALALRHGLETNDADLTAVVRDRYPKGYAAVLRDAGFYACLCALADVRNTVAHGKANLTPAEYQAFVSRAVAQVGFAEWDTRGPSVSPPPAATGAFHRHLGCLPDRPTGATTGLPGAIERLMQISPATGGGPAVALEARRFGRVSGTRAAPPPGTFLIGDRVEYVMTVAEPCALVLLSADVSGRVAVLRPSEWDAGPAAGEVRVPPAAADVDVRLEDGPGTGWVKAVATRRPLRTPLAPEAGAAFRELPPADAAALADELAALPPADWAAVTRELTVGW